MGTATARAAELEHLALAAEVAGLGPIEVVSSAERQLIVGGIRLHYLDWGGDRAAPVVFLHGGGLNAHTWDLVCLGLRDRHRCYALDLRGHGDSEWSPGCCYELSDHLGDLEGFVDQLHLGRIVLVGQSLGALVAIRYAARYPERVAALVAVDAGPYVAWSSGIEKIASFSLDRDHFESLEDAVEYALAFNPRRDRRLLRHSVTHALRPLPEGGWAWKRDLRNRSRGRLAAMVDQVADLVPEAATITCPTLVANGAESDVYGSDEAARFADLVIDGRWASIEGAGHNIQGDNPAGLLGVVRPFLAARNEALLEYLTELGAGGIEHPGGTLLEHLQRVAALLADWGARAELVSAGLLHAVYGTDGLPTRLRTLDQRPQVADRIGSEAEAIVYRYASCDRAFFFSGTREGDRRRFRDRFEDHVSLIAPKQLADFLELTFANELDLINTSPHFAAANGPAILSMFRPYADQVSQRARAAYVKAADLTTS